MKFTRGLALVPITTAILIAAPSAAMAYGYGYGGQQNPGWNFDYTTPETLVNTAKVWNGTDGTLKVDVSVDVRQSFAPQVRLINDVVASSRCFWCGSIALGFQIALVAHPAPKVYAESKAFAYNDRCVGCLTLALGYQFVVVTPLPLELSEATKDQLKEVAAELDRLGSENLPAATIEADAARQAEKVRSLLSADAAATNNPATVEVKRFADLDPR